MNTKFTLVLATAGSVLLSGCFDGDSSKDTSVRIVHASSDAPAVNVRVNNTTVLSGADYKQAAELAPRAGSSTIAIDGILPGGTTTTVIETDASLRFDTHYDVIAIGKVGDSSIAPLVLADDGNRSSSTSVRLRVAHLSPDAQAAAAGPVDVFVTAAGDPLPADATFTLSFKESVGPLEVPAGDYQIRVTPTGTDTVVYDSGTVPLPAGADLLIGAVDNTVFGASPVSLLVINGSDTSELLSAEIGVDLRAVHSAADIGAGPGDAETAVDVYVNATPGAGGEQTFSFGDTLPDSPATGLYVIGDQGGAAGDYDIVVTAAGSTTAAIEASLDLSAGDLRTVVAAGNASSGLEAFVFDDDNRRIATASKLRLIHGAVEAGTVEVYLVPTASGGAGATSIGNLAGSPTVPSFEYGSTTGYLQVEGGDYVAFITESGNPANVLYKSPSLELEASGVYSIVARLALPADSQIAGVTLMDDFVAP